MDHLILGKEENNKTTKTTFHFQPYKFACCKL